jgi:hypothetical protein
MHNLVKAFIIGSSLPVSFMFLRAVAGYDSQGIINYSYYNYSILAPLYFGIMTTFAVYLSKIHNISLRSSLFITSIISVIFIILLINVINAYKFRSNKRWYQQYTTLAIAHIITYNVIIYFLLRIFRI